MDWIKIVIFTGITALPGAYCFDPPVAPAVAIVTYKTRAAAVASEVEYQQAVASRIYTGRETRTVLLVHAGTVEVLTARQKTKTVKEMVEREIPDGYEIVAAPIEEKP